MTKGMYKFTVYRTDVNINEIGVMFVCDKYVGYFIEICFLWNAIRIGWICK